MPFSSMVVDACDVLEGKMYPLRHGYIGSCVSSLANVFVAQVFVAKLFVAKGFVANVFVAKWYPFETSLLVRVCELAGSVWCLVL